MYRLIFVVIDGMNAREGFRNLGYLTGLIEWKQGGAYTVKSELPAMSRPLYETLQTGLPVYQHGIVSNATVRPSCRENLFSRAKQAGLTTAAAAYHWICELYDACPFDPRKHRFSFREEKGDRGDIDDGIYYWTDDYPAEACFADGEYLLNNKHPDYLYIHTMNVDNAGHIYGGESTEYGREIMKCDVALAELLSGWLKEGYSVVVTADHGMNDRGYHNGPREEERYVPLFVFGDGIRKGDFREQIRPQREVTQLCSRILGLTDRMEGEDIYFETLK